MYELSEDLRKLGESVIAEFDKFNFLIETGCRIAYCKSDKSKVKGSMVTHADCQKVNDKMKALSGYDMVITFYAESEALNPKQQRILMEHELMHIGYEGEAFKIVSHDLEDFREIIAKYGMDWDAY